MRLWMKAVHDKVTEPVNCKAIIKSMSSTKTRSSHILPRDFVGMVLTHKVCLRNMYKMCSDLCSYLDISVIVVELGH